MKQGNKIILVLGILAIIASVFVFLEASSFRKKAVQTEGKVVHVLGSSYKIQYFTSDGTEKIIQGSGKTHGFREGNSVKVWYRTDNPGKARIGDGKNGSKVLLKIAIFCVIMGIYPLFLKKKDKSITT